MLVRGIAGQAETLGQITPQAAPEVLGDESSLAASPVEASQRCHIFRQRPAATDLDRSCPAEAPAPQQKIDQHQQRGVDRRPSPAALDEQALKWPGLGAAEAVVDLVEDHAAACSAHQRQRQSGVLVTAERLVAESGRGREGQHLAGPKAECGPEDPLAFADERCGPRRFQEQLVIRPDDHLANRRVECSVRCRSGALHDQR